MGGGCGAICGVWTLDQVEGRDGHLSTSPVITPVVPDVPPSRIIAKAMARCQSVSETPGSS